VPIAVLAGGAAAIWLAGGFELRDTQTIRMQVGDIIDVGPMTFQPLRALGSNSYDDTTRVIIEGYCHNTTDSTVRFLDQNGAFAMVNTQTLYATEGSILLHLGWGEDAFSEEINPTDFPVPCQLSSYTKEDLRGHTEIGLAIWPMQPSTSKYSSIKSVGYSYSGADPFSVRLPMEVTE
jgi:hypothetical protein